VAQEDGLCTSISQLEQQSQGRHQTAVLAQVRQAESGTINRELRVLRRCLRLAVEWEILERTPKVQMLRGEKRRERVVSEEELLRYLACAFPLLADVAITLNDTGLRPDECHRLQWENITRVNGRNGSLLVTEGKTTAARRVCQ
jgi:integrase